MGHTPETPGTTSGLAIVGVDRLLPSSSAHGLGLAGRVTRLPASAQQAHSPEHRDSRFLCQAEAKPRAISADQMLGQGGGLQPASGLPVFSRFLMARIITLYSCFLLKISPFQDVGHLDAGDCGRAWARRHLAPAMRSRTALPKTQNRGPAACL